MTNTTNISKKDLNQGWKFIDVRDKVLGRVASDIAKILIGKNKAGYSPTLNTGDKVVVTNASKIAVTGNKLSDKVYKRHTGYPGAVRSETLGHLLERRPEEALRRAVKGMLPKNKLQNERMKNLYIYEGEEHPHKAHEKK